MMSDSFENRLSGGHPNSLGDTLNVVDDILADQEKLTELIECYDSSDEVVRLRTSNALKRVQLARPSWLLRWTDHLLENIAQIDQASTQWTLAQIFRKMKPDLTDSQYDRAVTILLSNLKHSNDWIVLTQTMETLSSWATRDDGLQKQLKPLLHKHGKDERRSVRNKAEKMLVKLI
ncbi:hypothetical protein [Parasphingorhabdus halotolerans]|nr:hypothetical protein [Parasphingorhabdus halotolerans]